MFDMRPEGSPPRNFVIAPEQIGALVGYLESEGFRQAAPLADAEAVRMINDLEVVVLLYSGAVRTAGEHAARAATRLLMVCKE